MPSFDDLVEPAAVTEGDGEAATLDATEATAGESLRVELQISHKLFVSDYCVAVLWLETGELHAALMDYRDGDDISAGIDIPEPELLLAWLVHDRFGTDVDGLLAYCDSSAISVHELAVGAAVLSRSEDASHWQTAPDGAVLARIDPADDRVVALVGWKRLVLLLLVDRCGGDNAWAEVQETCRLAGVPPVERWRGYM